MVRAVAVLLVAVLCLSGCVSVRQGTAMRDPDADVRSINPALLDTGPYPTRRRPSVPVAGGRGPLVEARRMSEVFVQPFEIVADLNRPSTLYNGPFTDTLKLISVLPEGISSVVGLHNFVSGFKNETQIDLTDMYRESTVKNMTAALLRFATDADAESAAADLAARSVVPARKLGHSVLPERREVPMPDRPGTAMFASDDDGIVVALVYARRGPLIAVYQIQDTSLDSAAAIAGRAVELQQKALDGFVPTPVDRLGNLAPDPTGLLSRVLGDPLPLPVPRPIDRTGVYSARAALNFASYPERSRILFDSNGVDAVAFGGTTVYQSWSQDAAQKVVDFLSRESEDRGYTRGDPVANLPGSRCLVVSPASKSYRPGHYECLATAGNYAISVIAERTDAHQRLAAQYLMLTAS